MSDAPTALTVRRTKILEYLLNVDHPEGGSKARFFLSCGFSKDEPQDFIRELFWHASEDEFVRAEHGLWGTKFIFEGMLITPDGRNPRIRSIWHRTHSGSVAELVTAYPIPPPGDVP